MTKVITTSTIVLTLVAGQNADKQKGTPRVAPVTFDVPSQVTIDVTGDDLKALLDLKAVREPLPADKVLPPEFKLPKHLPISGKTPAQMQEEAAALKAQEENDRVAAERERVLEQQRQEDEDAQKAKADTGKATTATATGKKSAGARTSGKKAAAAKETAKEADTEKAKAEDGAGDDEQGSAPDDEDDGSNLV